MGLLVIVIDKHGEQVEVFPKMKAQSPW